MVGGWEFWQIIKISEFPLDFRATLVVSFSPLEGIAFRGVRKRRWRAGISTFKKTGKVQEIRSALGCINGPRVVSVLAGSLRNVAVAQRGKEQGERRSRIELELKTGNFLTEKRHAGTRHEVISWRILLSCFSVGSFRCLNSDAIL